MFGKPWLKNLEGVHTESIIQRLKMGFTGFHLGRDRSASKAVWSCLYLLLLLSVHSIKNNKALVFAELDEDTGDDTFEDPPEAHNASTSGVPLPKEGGEGSIAEIIDRVLEKEFPENEQQEGVQRNAGSSFNNSVSEDKAVLETVARVMHDKPKRNDTQEENGTSKPFQIQDVFRVDTDNGAEELPTLIDQKDNIFIMSNRKSKYPVLELDSRFISDLVVVIISATVGGMIFAFLGQPVITGYLLAGSFIGPGGFSYVSERVQVDTVAQFGVVFLLFALGLEFSSSKLRIVRSVAIFGGLLQILLFMCLCGLTAFLCGAKATEGIFVGAFVSMSSTAVVLKFLMDRNGANALHGQVTIGTLILQDCCVGLLFALIPVLGGNSGMLQGFISITRSLFTLATFLTITMLVARSFVPRFFKLISRLSSQTNELYELAAVAFCLAVAWCSDKLGLSLELGSFVAGVMISTTDYAPRTLEQVEPIRNLFSALFLASIGMLIDAQFLWSHMDILLASVILVIITKTVVIAFVVRAFGYSTKTSFLVGTSLAQIGEFAFLLLSRAHNLHLIEKRLYLLLLGTTALSLVTTPLLFRFIPVLMQLGVLMQWFSSESILVEAFTKGGSFNSVNSQRFNVPH